MARIETKEAKAGKTKKTVEPLRSEKDEALERAIAQIEKQYGTG